MALGGNALLRRGQALTDENQRRNVATACESLAPIALEHQLVVSHGNGPQVGLLALQGAAYAKVPTYPLDVLDAETQGMIGYVVEQELGNRLPIEVPLATLLTMIEVDRDDPAFADPSKPIGPLYDRTTADALDGSGAGRSSPMATRSAGSCRRPSPSGSSSCARSGGCSSAAAWSSALAGAASRRRTSPGAGWWAWRP